MQENEDHKIQYNTIENKGTQMLLSKEQNR
jgi:hypothetical protein